MIIGLDCAEPSLVLERWRGELPMLDGLIERGLHGRLTSVIPPITVPAWSCMMASRTPGDLGVYGFRNRADHSYDGLFIANGTAIKEPRLWDYATRRGKRSIVLGVPGTFPPRPLNGVMVTCFLTPSTESQYTYPPMLRREVEQVVGEYLFDVKDFRTEDKEYLLRQVYEMTDRRFALAEHLLATKPWELFAMVEMGPDRMHHGFWKDMDPEHRKHVPGGPYEDAILDYHRHVDGLIGAPARARRRRDGGAGRLRPRREAHGRRHPRERVAAPRGPAHDAARARGRTSLADVGIDWPRTTAWGEGGYYSRVFLNVRGREPEGTIAPEDYERVRADLARRLEAIPDEKGEPDRDEGLLARGGLPRGERRRARPDRPLRRPAVARGRHGRRRRGHPHVRERHRARRREPRAGRAACPRRARASSPAARGMHLLDVAPTVLELLGIDAPATMRGRSLLAPAAAPHSERRRALLDAGHGHGPADRFGPADPQAERADRDAQPRRALHGLPLEGRRGRPSWPACAASSASGRDARRGAAGRASSPPAAASPGSRS